MRLEPVYLVAPKQKPPSIPTRRAFLLAGGTFAVGLGLGSACGYAMGSGRGDAADASASPELVPSGDADLDELRRLAVKAPIEELVAKRFDFLSHLYKTYTEDEIAWQGVGRLAEAALSNTGFPDRRMFSHWLAQVIEGSKSTVRQLNDKHVEQLRQVK